MIELQRVSLRAGNFALHDISLRVESGEYAVLMGRTGRGKTTLLEAICGLRKVESGRIVLHGDDVTEWSPADRQIGYVPQDLALFPTLTVRQHLEFAVRLRKSPPAVIRQRGHERPDVVGRHQAAFRKLPRELIEGQGHGQPSMCGPP